MTTNMTTRAYTAAQAADLDRYTIEELGVDLKQLMEIAGMRSAEIACEQFGDGAHITVLAGPGGNGSDALVCAKWLHIWGLQVTLRLSHEPAKLKPVTQHQLGIWQAYSGQTNLMDQPEFIDGIVDGLLGYSLSGDPRGHAADLINWANGTGKPILALDIPSGMDATTGEIRTPCIRAGHTAVYGVLKQGLMQSHAGEYAGEIHLIDIGFPREFPPSASGS